MDIKHTEWLNGLGPAIKPKRDNDAHYHQNSCGFRDHHRKDMWQEDWKDSIVLFGCSQTYGQALEDQDTWAYKLEKLTGKQVINLSKPGTSINFIALMLLKARQNIKPWAIVVNWPAIHRYYEWHTSRNGFLTFDIQNRDEALYQFILENPEYQENQAQYHLEASRLMWVSQPTRWVELTWNHSLKYDSSIHYVEALDRAADDAHWGPQTCTHVAELVSDQLLNSF